ncbi:hypothetical protein ES708_25929 [subsurface metagenome]
MSKGSFEFVDVALFEQRKRELQEREEKEQTKVFRVCQRCKVRKPVYQFSKDKRNTLKNGRKNVCKVCSTIEYLKYYYANRENVLLTNKRYRDDHKGYRTKYFENYQKTHKEHLQKVAAIWYKKNRKRIKKRNLERKLIL